MAYIGKQPEFTQYPSKFFDGDGTAMTVTLDYAPPNDAALLVFISGVRQDTSAYSCTGTSCTFTGAVPSGTANVQVVHMGLTVDVGVPGDDTVTTVKIQDDAVTAAKLANSINTEITANTAKVTNATHTGDVTGATALTIATDAVDIAMLSATGTASSSTFLRGDNAWTEVSGGSSWQAVVTAATLTAVAGNGYPINTTSNVCVVTLPATASVGDTIEFVDYAGTWDTNKVELDPQSLNIKGASDSLFLTYERQGVRIVYVDATQGWVAVTGVNEIGKAISSFVASGGTETTYTDAGINYKTHTFLSSGTFVVTGTAGLVDVMIVGGGGAGQGGQGGAGGGGGIITMVQATAPLGNSAIVIGAGGTEGSATATAGVSTTVFGETATGGGAGGRWGQTPASGGAGANGGGGGDSTSSVDGVGTIPTVVSGTATGRGGFDGGTGSAAIGAGGGGASEDGENATGGGAGGDGGAGLQWNYDGNNYYWSGGGGGASYYGQAGDGGIGGGGTGAWWSSACSGAGTGSAGSPGGSAINSGGAAPACGAAASAGGANSGAGGGSGSSVGGTGGSGIVQIRYIV